MVETKFRLAYYIELARTRPTMCRECTNVVVASLWRRPGGSCHGRSRLSRYASTLRFFLTLSAFQRHLLVFLKLLGTCRDGKSGFSIPEGDRQPDKVQRSPEVEVVLPDVSKTMSRRGGKVFTSASCRCAVVVFNALWSWRLIVCLLCLLTERFQMSLHVRVPPEAAAAGLGEPQQVHGLLLQVGASCSHFV